MKKKIIIPITALLLLSPLNTLASSDYYNKSKKELDLTNKNAEKKYLEEIKSVTKETDGRTYDKFGFGIKGGELDLIFEEIGDIVVGEQIAEGEETKYKVSITDKLMVSDLRGTGEGWSLNLTATPFTSYLNGKVFDKLPSGTFTVSGSPSVKPTTNLTDKIPSTEFYGRKGEVAIDDGGLAVVSAQVGEGRGNWKVDSSTMNFFINLKNKELELKDSSSKPTPYTTTLTWTLTSGPNN